MTLVPDSLRRWAAPWMLIAAAFLSACGGGGDSPPAGPQAVQLDTTRATTARLGSAGGSIRATASDVRAYILTVPPGALADDTEITATPVTSMGSAPLAAGTRGAVRFGPAGLTFLSPATLRIEGVATNPSRGGRLVGFVRSDDGAQMQIVPTGVAGAALELPVPHFSDVGVSEASPAEVAVVPPAVVTGLVNQMFEEAGRGLSALPDPAPLEGVAAVFGALIDRLVVPAQARAAASTDPAVRAEGVQAYAFLARILELSVAPAETPRALGLLAGRMERARDAAAALLRADFDSGLADCTAPGPADLLQARGMNAAAAVSATLPESDLSAQRIGLSLRTPALGLDSDTLRRRLNDCARVVFVPLARPGFENGRPVSLDQQAAVVLATDASDNLSERFDFRVVGTEADVANPTGFSDALGRYTTVVTPRSAQPEFSTRACYLAQLHNRAVVVSELCGTQSVGGSAAIVLSGELRIAEASAQETTTSQLRLRIRAEPDGGFTVLEATGQESTRSSFVSECFNEIERRTVNVPRVNTIDSTITSAQTITNPATGLPGAFFELLGQRVETVTVFTVGARDCSTQLSTDIRQSVRVITPTRIERDARGPTAMVFGQTGRLVRE